MLSARVTEEGVCILCRVLLSVELGLGKVRNCCNASSCLLRHSYTVLYFQGSGNRRVTVNAIA